MPKKRVLIPGDIIYQEFWKNPLFARAWTTLWVATSDRSISADTSWFLKELQFTEQQFLDFRDIDYIKNVSFKIDDLMGLISFERRSSTLTYRADPEKKNETEEFAIHILSEFNRVFGTRFKNYNSFIKNLEYWLDFYTPNDIVDAIHAAKKDEFWGDKMTPLILFRKTNKAGVCDYIGDMLNKHRVGKAFRPVIDHDDRMA